MVRKAPVAVKSASAAPRKGFVVRKKKTEAGSPAKEAAAASAVAGKRKRKTPTKLELHRRMMREKRIAKAIAKEQNRSVVAPACSKNSIRRMIRSALQNVAKERQMDPDVPGQPYSIARKAVEMLHQVLEQHAVSEFNQCSFLLEYAKKTTCTPDTMLCLKRARLAAEQRPVFELPEADRPQPVEDGVEDGEEEEEEDDASFTGSDAAE